MNHGKLMLREVGARSMDVSFSQEDDWVKAALLKAAPHEDLVGMDAATWAKRSQLTGTLTAERIEPEYSVYGSFSSRVPILCPRCGEEGTVGHSSDFRIFLKPLGPRETAEESDDPDYIFLETPYIDLVDLLCEQIVATEGVVERPDLDRSGKPHDCNIAIDLEALADEKKNSPLAVASGQTSEKGRNSPFAVLGKLKNVQAKGPNKDEG